MKIVDALSVRVIHYKIENIRINNSDLAYIEMENIANIFRNQFQGIAIGSIPGVSASRKFFKEIGIDPTKHRPSSEALLNRAMKSKPLFAVNNLVDLGNWCSLEFLLPVCLYDSKKIVGEIQLRKGLEDDKYLGINKREVNLTNRYAFADEKGAFGSPMKDSLRTSITATTTECDWFMFLPDNFNDDKISEISKKIISRVEKFCEGKLVSTKILSYRDA